MTGGMPGRRGKRLYVPDSPPLTGDFIARMRPGRGTMPLHLYEKLLKAYEERRARKAREREDVTLSLDRDAVLRWTYL